MALPAWVTSNEQSLADEASDYIGMTPEQRGVLLAQLCRDAARILAIRSDAKLALNYRDPLPENSRRLLERLRTAHRAHQIDHG
jgi:hypothetical protein